MTTKEIAESVGKDERTVQRWVKRLSDKMSSVSDKMTASSPMKPADYDLEETCAIIEIGLGKNAAALFRENARNREAPAVGSSLTARDMEVIGGIVAAIMAGMTARVEKIEAVVDTRRAMLPAPQIKPRDHINMIVREYAQKSGCPHGQAWGELYRQFGYRTNTNPTQCAKNRGMAIIDYIEAEGQIDTLEAVAMDALNA